MFSLSRLVNTTSFNDTWSSVVKTNVAATMLRCPKRTKKRVEQMTLGIIATEIARSAIGSLFYYCKKLSVMSGATSPPLSQAQGDHQRGF